MSYFQSKPSTDISLSEIELTKIFKEQYNDIFPNIRNLNQNSFVSILEKQVTLSLKILNKTFSNILIKKILNIFTKQYINDRAIITNGINDLLKIKPENLPYIENFNYYIHCVGCNEALHKCGNCLIYYENHIYCLSCEEVFKPEHLILYCNEHNLNYYSSIREITNLKKKFLFNAQFAKNHCINSNNILMTCQICNFDLYIDISKGKNCYNNLICDNCRKIFETSKLFFNCDICNKKYNSEAKIYVDFDKKKIENLCIIHAIIKNDFASPSFILSKQCNCDIENNCQYKHSCGGILLIGNLIDKKVIVCNKCYEIINYEKFQWNCPLCDKRIRTKVIITCKSSYKNKNFLKDISDSFSNKISKERENNNSNNFNRAIMNSSLRLFKKNLQTESNISRIINNDRDIKVNISRKISDNRIDLINYCTPSETKKMHNILFQFMNKNDKDSFRSSHKPRTNIITGNINLLNSHDNIYNNINKINNHNKSHDNQTTENNINVNKLLNLNKFPETNNKQNNHKFIGKNPKITQIKFNLNQKLDDYNKKEVENSDKLNTNFSNGQNSSSTNSGSNEKKSFSKTYFKTSNSLLNEEENKSDFDADDYDIIKLIGEGTFGKIYLVENPINHIRYAMKKISASSMDEINEKKKEYELLIHLNNENPKLNTVKIIGIQTKKLDKLTFVMYILMELADYDWEKEIKRRTKNKLYYNEDELIKILKSIIDTFSLLQTKGISHRDVKPQNILCFIKKNDNNKNNKFDNNNNTILYKIADFGEAKTKEKKRLEEQKSIEENYQNDTNKQTVRGTELYMSPLLFKAYRTYPFIGNIQYNAFKNDVFSLGLTFLYAATLTFQSLYEIREVYDMDCLKSIVEKYLKGKYSDNYINCILLMLQIHEKKRPDFVDLVSWVNNHYSN